MQPTRDPMRDIRRMDDPTAAWPWPVHWTGAASDPPVIVMHELYGVSPIYTQFCRDLASDGFSVWMPQLVGTAPSISAADRARAISAVCISREIDVLRSGRTSPVVARLRTLAQHLAHTHDGRPVGVVGMCLSGGFALAMAADPAITAAVAAQPALPLRPLLGRSLGLSADDVGTISSRLVDRKVKIFYTRFARDHLLSPKPRCDRVVNLLGPEGIETDVVTEPGFRILEHSVLTEAPNHYGTQGPQAERLARTAARVSEFLHENLQ